MITEEYYTNEIDEAKLLARKWQEAHDVKAKKLIFLEGKMREIRIVLLTAFKFINEQIDK